MEEKAWGTNHRVLKRNQARGIQEESTPDPEGEASKRNPRRGTLTRDSSKSSPGAGVSKRTWSKSLGRVVMVWRHQGGT